jgi:hypothetical protein
MPGKTTARGQKQALDWTPHLIKRLRGKRTQAELSALLGAPKNTVWCWEAGQARPEARYAARLSALAEREHFLTDWQLVGSMTLLGDLESAKDDIAKLFRTSLERTSRQLAE